MLIQFHKQNIQPEWQDLVDEFQYLFFDLGPSVLELFECYSDPEFKTFPNSAGDLCNLRYGFECDVAWKGAVRDFFAAVDSLMKEAKENGHDFHYRPFILKEKFGSCRDFGDVFGRDANLYRERCNELRRKLIYQTKYEQKNTQVAAPH
jgi:hypothetical protein